MDRKTPYFLMHKDLVVCSFLLSNDGEISSIQKLEKNIAHFPISGQFNNSNFIEWWKSRAISESKKGIKSILEKLGYTSVGNALVDNLALSLNDCYWIKPFGSSLLWEQVNLFSNDFNDSIGDLEFDFQQKLPKRKKNKFDLASSSGELKKKWFIGEDNKRYLIKGNMGNSYQQSINEVFISQIHQQLNSPFSLKYELVNIKVDDNRQILGCKCANFCNEHVEFIPAYDLIRSEKQKGSDNPLLLFKRVCLKLGMKEEYFHSYMDYLIMTDYLFTNIDRHMNNIGILRDPDTLQLIGFAPIFDNGNSMFYNLNYDDLNNLKLNKIKINSFFDNEARMLTYVRNNKCIDLDKIEFDLLLYEKDIKESRIRYDKIEKLFKQKILMLKEFQKRNP